MVTCVVTEATFKIVTDSLNFCHAKKGLRINAYVIMPTHFHAILFHDSFQAKPLENAVTDFRKYTGRQLADYAQDHLPACFRETFRARTTRSRQEQPFRLALGSQRLALARTNGWFDAIRDKDFLDELLLRAKEGKK